MIQRIQTVYILFAIVAAVFAAVLNWVSYVQDGASVAFIQMPETLYLQVVLGLAAILMLVAIARFKARKGQMAMVRFSMWCLILSYVVFGIVHYFHIEQFQEIGPLDLQYEFAPALPAIAAVLLWMANRAIKKDEDLVRSVDRLR